MSVAELHPGYKSIVLATCAEQVIKKSHFIANVFPVANEADVQSALSAVKAEHPGASHICFAYRCGLVGEMVRFHDAGEPGGTAGRPILEVIEREGLRNTLITVTRYFGGVLLGAAGLVRAYTGSAAAVVAAADKSQYEWHVTYRVTVQYTEWGRIERLLREQGYPISNPQFTADVAFNCRVLAVASTNWQALILDATGGQGLVVPIGEGYFPVTT